MYSRLRLIEPPVDRFLRLIRSNYFGTKVTLLSRVDCTCVLCHNFNKSKNYTYKLGTYQWILDNILLGTNVTEINPYV